MRFDPDQNPSHFIIERCETGPDPPTDCDQAAAESANRELKSFLISEFHVSLLLLVVFIDNNDPAATRTTAIAGSTSRTA
jgi:hypothetical protein